VSAPNKTPGVRPINQTVADIVDTVDSSFNLVLF